MTFEELKELIDRRIEKTEKFLKSGSYHSNMVAAYELKMYKKFKNWLGFVKW